MADTAKLTFRDQTYELPVVEGTEHELGIDISKLRAQSGLITLDESYANTGSCQSRITFIDGEKGILRYRGYPIEQLAEQSTFVETAYLVIFGELPTSSELERFRNLLSQHQYIHEDMRHHFEGFPPNAHPMAILSAMINAASCYQPVLTQPPDLKHFEHTAARLISKVRTIAAASYKKSIGRPMIYPRPDLPYTANFLHMMFSAPYEPYEPDPDIVRALDQLLILHVDHEQNCSTSTVRMVGSSRANLFASVAAGVCALWGPLHGGANQAVLHMLTQMREEGISAKQYLERVKDKSSGIKLMGFGHRVYKNFDPRAKIIKNACDVVLKKLNVDDPLLDIAQELEAAALEDSYFVERKLYPNVDFYSGIIMRAIGIPVNMFTVMFAIGRMPGWIAHWREVHSNPNARIYRPRQIYTGAGERDYVPIEKRGR
ncbi:MAG: citrate synthase [Planctomycetota bacterium]|nr:MAG: citrate synthase [Planctomycetota bacterium]